MARIRTIKPEFWTDETIVRLPFEARLLFIGMWNFADDSGAIEYSPDRLRLQILPADSSCDIGALIDLLEAAGLISYWVDEQGTQALSINKWAKHQKIDNPSRKTVIRDGYRKQAIPSEARIGVAKKYDCKPGGSADASCYYCGMPGQVHWWASPNGKPTRWITLSDLEFDHFVSEHAGGENSHKNIVLACRACNRGKREFDPHQFFVEKNFPVGLARTIEPSSLDQGEERKGDPPLTPPPDGDGGEKPKRERKPRVSLKTFIAKCVEAGEKPISEYRPLQEYVQATGLPMEFVQLCWQVFKAEFLPPGAKAARLQADWRRHFLTFVEKGYYRLWFAKADGSFELTTAGLQARSFHGHREAA